MPAKTGTKKAPADPKPGKNGAAKKGKAETPAAEVMYPEFKAKKFVGDDALTVDQMKTMLGWETESDKVKFGPDYLFKDFDGNKVWLTRSTRNRPFTYADALRLSQEHLMRKWRGRNGETIVIGKTGEVISGQHRGVSLVLAEQRRTSEREKHHWEELGWAGPVTMEALVVFGVEEDDETVNTIDTGRPRTLADVLYRSPYFANKGAADRRALSRATEYAIHMLWRRTGAGAEAFAVTKTHSEAVDFLNRHGKLLTAVNHVFEENGEKNKIGRLLSLGYSAAMLYLMGAARSDVDDYRNASPRSEAGLDLSLWDKAEEFFTVLAGGGEELAEAATAIGRLIDPEQGGGATHEERMAVLAKAWGVFLQDSPVTADDVKLKYKKEDDGTFIFVENPTVGGIDLGYDPDKTATPAPAKGGKPKAGPADGAPGEVVDETTDPTPEEIEAEKEKIKAEHLEAKRNEGNGPWVKKPAPKPLPKKKPAPAAS